MDLIFATGNKGKLREASEILGPAYHLVTPSELGCFDDIEETGTTMRENALIKAEYLWSRFGKNCFADDSGLEVDALGGAPGVYTARYAGDDKDFIRNMQKVLDELDKVDDDMGRRARFRCVIALIFNGEKYFFEGTLEGRIAREMSGSGGFGYDPIFIPEGYSVTLAEVSEDEKNSISHRFVALSKMQGELKRITSF